MAGLQSLLALCHHSASLSGLNNAYTRYTKRNNRLSHGLSWRCIAGERAGKWACQQKRGGRAWSVYERSVRGHR